MTLLGRRNRVPAFPDTPSPRGSAQERQHLGVSDLGEVGVELTDRPEPAGLQRAHHLVDLGGERGDGLRWADWQGAHQTLRFPPGHMGQGSAQGRPGGHTVVRDDHHPARHRRHHTEHLLTAPHLGDGIAHDAVLCRCIDAQTRDEALVEKRHPIRGDRPDGEFGVVRSPHLDRAQHPELAGQGRGDLGGHDDATAGHAEHERRSAGERFQQAGEHSAGFTPIAVPGHDARLPTGTGAITGTVTRMRRLLLVANPAASGFTAMLHRSVLATLRTRFEVTPIWPNGPEEAEAEAATAAAAGFDVVAAMGGDGIVHRVANGLVGSGTALAVIPAGTSNVFARLTGHPRRGSAAAAAIVESRGVLRLPTARLVAEGDSGRIERAAVFAAGVGLDADLIRESDRKPLRKVGAGTLHYTRSAMRVALGEYRRRLPDLSVTVDDASLRAVTVIAQIHQDFTYLGRRPLTISPGGGPAVVCLRRATPARLIRVVIAAARRRDPAAVPGVRVWHPFKTVTVAADRTVGLEADGEYLGEVTALAITLEPGSLGLIDPRGVPRGK